MRKKTEYLTVIRSAPTLVVGNPSYSEGGQEWPPRVWCSPEIDASKFTLHILSDTPGGFQWLKDILLMLCNAAHHLGDRNRVILHHRVQGSVRAVRAVRNSWVLLTEAIVVADVGCIWNRLKHHLAATQSTNLPILLNLTQHMIENSKK
jgi:hypothetical protein